MDPKKNAGIKSVRITRKQNWTRQHSIRYAHKEDKA